MNMEMIQTIPKKKQRLNDEQFGKETLHTAIPSDRSYLAKRKLKELDDEDEDNEEDDDVSYEVILILMNAQFLRLAPTSSRIRTVWILMKWKS